LLLVVKKPLLLLLPHLLLWHLLLPHLLPLWHLLLSPPRSKLA
jgi:hypothetical protein